MVQFPGRMSRRCIFAVVAAIVTLAQSTLPAQNVTLQQGVVVLNDGRVFTGTIRQVAGGYRVDSTQGYTILPFDEVHITAESLVAAYEAMRDATVKPSTEQHLTLAEWCLNNGLKKQARLEVAWALKLEPLRTEARLLLARIDAETRQPEISPQKPAMTADGFRQPAERNQTGLTRETHQEFIRHIQPILMNSCANAACHGVASDNDLKLTMVRRRSQNIRASQENLEELLKFISPQNPQHSPLLLKATEHSDHHQRLFVGSSGEQTLKVLKAWVQQVSPEGKLLDQSASSPVAHADRGESNVEPASSFVSPDAEPVIQQAGGTIEPRQSTKELLQEVRAAQKPDAFDPEIFNRMMHPQTNNSPTAP